MNDTARQHLPSTVVETARQPALTTSRGVHLASVRVSPGGYFAVASICTYAALLLLYMQRDLYALILLALGWIITPAFALTDRVSFDGHSLSRKGVVALVFRFVRGHALHLKLDGIETVETNAVRTLKRGGSVRYRYRTEVHGDGVKFIFASGGKSYRHMVRSLLPLIPDDKLDARSAELRDYLTDSRSLHVTLGVLRLAPSVVLEGATPDLQHGVKRGRHHQRLAARGVPSAADVERGHLLRRTANELRAVGRLREAAEAFRRALLMMPHDGWLVYEFARFLRSQASMLSDAHLLARSRAALRLAARRCKDDALLLTRIGESFFEHSDLNHAALLFRRALEENPHAYRAAIGLAEIALHNGKLAHVIHHYNDAARIAPDEALARFARREADYYAQLNMDDDYLSAELRRMGWLQHIQRARRLAARVTFASILLVLVGTYTDEVLSSLGWSLASSSIIAWISIALAAKFFVQRRIIKQK